MDAEGAAGFSGLGATAAVMAAGFSGLGATAAVVAAGVAGLGATAAAGIACLEETACLAVSRRRFHMGGGAGRRTEKPAAAGE